MPPVVGAVASAAGAYIAGASIAAAAKVFATSLFLSFASRALQKDEGVGDSAGRSQGRTQTVRESVQPRAVVFGKVRKGGTFALIHTTGSNNKTLHLVIALADHQVKSIGAIYFGNELAVDSDGDVKSPYSGLVQAEKRLGSDDQSAIDIPEAGSLWGSDHRLRGVAHIYLQLEYDQDAFPNGIPNVSVDLEGYDQVYDPRTDTTGYSRNPALCVAAYLTSSRWGIGASWDDIDEDALIEAANACDETVDKEDGGSEPRYQCDGLFTTDEQPRDVLEDLLSAMAGEAVNTGGLWVIHAGVYREPDFDITADDFRGGIQLQTRVSRRETFNRVAGTYISPENEWEPADFPVYASDFYIDQDGREITRDIELPFTISPSAAQRIAKIELQRARLEQTLEAPLGLRGVLTRAGDTVSVNYGRWGFDEKPFQVRELSFSDDETLGIDLLLRETSPLAYDWDATEEEVIEAAPPTTLPSAREVPQPNVPTVSEELYVTRRSAGVRVLARLDWSGSGTTYVDRWQVEIKPDGGNWRRVPAADTIEAEIRDIEPGVYRFRVRAVNRLGVTSEWAETPDEQIVGTDAPPSQITGLTISAIGGMAVLRWDQHPDLDVLVGGSIQFRHARQQSNATWASSVSVGERMPGSTTEAVLPLKPGSYLAKARDAQGNPSSSAAIVSTKAGEVLSFADIDTITEDPSWAGDKTNVEEDGGNLVLVDGETEGTYGFAAGFDFGSVRKFRLRTEIAVSVINTTTNIDDRDENIDDWADFDQTADAEADVQIWVRTTDDDPSGSPEWTEWERIDSAEYEARGAEFEARFQTETTDYLPQINELTIRAEEIA